MDKLIEGLVRLSEEELVNAPEIIEAEGADYMGTFGEIAKLVNDVIDGVVDKGYILFEDLEFFNEKQMNCIRELGELLDRLETY